MAKRQHPNNLVLFVCEQGESACAYYRAFLPGSGLQKLGWQVGISNMMIQLDDGTLTGVDHKGRLFDPPNILVVRRLNDYEPGKGDSGTFQSCANMFREARKMGQRVYVDLDDDPWTLPEWNPAYGNMTSYELELWQEDMNTANGVICSTPAIALNVERHADAAAFVCRNGIDRTLYRYRSAGNTPLRLGWVGTTDYRARDLATAVPALKRALAGKLGEVEFWHIGFSPNVPSVREILGPDFPVQIVERAWVPILALPMVLPDLDSAIVPMESHPFNDARSNVTGLALCAAGVPFAHSIQPEYQQLWHAGAGHPTGDDGWEHAIAVLTDKEYADARSDMRSAGLQVADLHSPTRIAAQYVTVFNG